MAVVYDNWERLVQATLRREELRITGLRTPSDLSLPSSSPSFSFSFSSSSRPLFSSFEFSGLLVGDSFSYHQILQATDYLSSSNLIKHGCNWDLFYGVLEGGTQVVVKKVDLSSAEKESYLRSELEFFNKVSHSRFVPLLGHCWENWSEKFLVYKYMLSKDLSSSLHGEKDSPSPLLDWMTRIKIATGAAEGLCYLHHECVPHLVHRNVEASSILLDENFEVRLGGLHENAIHMLGRFSHPNIIELLGYCWEDKDLILVYEFMQKGSLDNHLYGRGSAIQPLPWDIRLKILIGAARGLAFLHALKKQVIYRDVKSSNILLDGSYNAKISSFGLARLGPSDGDTHVTTRLMGTYGYAAPEYLATGHLHVKSDVYGFGVVLAEMLTGLRALDTRRPKGQHVLVYWIKPHLSDKRKIHSILDTKLQGKCPIKAAVQIAQLALTCLSREPKARPSMKEVVDALEYIESANEKPRGPRTNLTH